jgi:hypothetical protein
VGNKEQITKNQHYVPRCYLNNFAEHIGEGKKEKVMVSFYQFDNETIKENVPTKSICYERYFYGEDGVWEKNLSNKENKWAQVFRKIRCSAENGLDEEVVYYIKEFAIYQYSRTPALLEHIEKSKQEFLLETIGKNSSSYENSNVIAEFLEMCDDMITQIEDLSVSVIKFETKQKLITSDMPIVFMNAFTPDTVGLLLIGTIILFPISKDMLIIVYDKKTFVKIKPYYINKNETDVINLNKYQLLNAQERIIAENKEELEKYTTKEFLKERTENSNKEIVNKNACMHGKMLEFKSKNTKYCYTLSFCEVRKEMKKIPLDCRSGYPRIYDRDYHNKLMIACTKIPETIMQLKVPVEEKKKRKKGYQQLKKCIEDYWELPSYDRSIPSELRKKIKNNEGISFIPTKQYLKYIEDSLE